MKNRDQKRQLRVRRKIKGQNLPRLIVFRSNKHIYAQVIDINNGTVLACASDLKSKLNKKLENAEMVGLEVAKKALKAGVKSVVFDRGSFKYHGRIKALAEKAREGGLKF